MTSHPRLPPGYGLSALDSVDSTNEEAIRRARDGAPAGLVVWALEQTRGRGRRGRLWQGGAGNLMCSVLLRPGAAPGVAAQLGFVAALAVADAAAAMLPAEHDGLRLKWPNDVLARGRKLSGILLEATAAPDGRLAWLVVGVGINLAAHPEGTETPATDIATEGGRAVAPGEGLELWLAAFDRWAAVWADGTGFSRIRAAWLDRAWNLGGRIRVRTGQEDLEGIFAGLDEDGALVLDSGAGAPHRIAAGDVFPAAA